ncbi:hypothetical protein MNB_SM-7-1216 [hydrothermal vent metagenome]|uniref:Uncharacterized protein n=1 Tax=hydrothermal vent metagenome TaxID=652676 RepID=A0A1W1BF77_9ZZZZ
MAKKKKSIDLREKKVLFEMENEEFMLERFYPSNMSVDVVKLIDGKRAGVTNLPFAHLPKKIKQYIKPK